MPRPFAGCDNRTATVSPASENARTVQEDCHRLALQPGSSVVYRVKEPINRCRVYSFAPAEANLEFSVSADGKKFRSVAVDRAAFPSSQTVYGYATPILFAGEVDGGDATYLRIAFVTRPLGENRQARQEAATNPT